MRQYKQYPITDTEKYKNQLLYWCGKQERVCYLDSNTKFAATEADLFRTRAHDFIVGVGAESELVAEKNAFNSLTSFYQSKKDWLFGYFTYDLKNELENLYSKNQDQLLFPALHFFQPQLVFSLRENRLSIGYLTNRYQEKEIDAMQTEIMNAPLIAENQENKTTILPRISKEKYLNAVSKLKEHIHQGDIYEVNFCQEFYAENASINPVEIYQKLNTISQTPFAAFYRLGNNYLMCASPERFLKKTGNKIISQPIKGTIKRGANKKEDDAFKALLYNDPKERSENVMIVDLVRNDLSRTAKRGSVKVEELFGIYSFLQVHQLISTVSAELKESLHFIDVIKNAFPMGSMTGAPKIKAMELIEKYESTKRGLYSGAVGYISPEGDFDFNVVIRSILYNAEKNYLSFMVGSAITAKSIAEKEYEECLLKAKAMFEVLNSKTYLS